MCNFQKIVNIHIYKNKLLCLCFINILQKDLLFVRKTGIILGYTRVYEQMSVHKHFPNMSLECLLYPIHYLFLAPHISVPIDSSDSRQGNNHTSLPLTFSPPLLLPSPRSTKWRDENRNKRREEGRRTGRTSKCKRLARSVSWTPCGSWVYCWEMEEKVKVEVNKKDKQASGSLKNFNRIILWGAFETWEKKITSRQNNEL